jgi:hypothetical protein
VLWADHPDVRFDADIMSQCETYCTRMEQTGHDPIVHQNSAYQNVVPYDVDLPCMFSWTAFNSSRGLPPAPPQPLRRYRWEQRQKEVVVEPAIEPEPLYEEAMFKAKPGTLERFKVKELDSYL